MTKAILMSIQPKWLEKILKGEKTIEVRKTMPKCELPIEVYLYCTKSNEYLYYDNLNHKYFTCRPKDEEYSNNLESETMLNRGYNSTLCTKLNCKVVAKFTLNKVDEIILYSNDIGQCWYECNSNTEENSCLSDEELTEYLYPKNGFAWHIDNLQIFDEPIELSEFYKYDNSYDNSFGWLFEDRQKYIPLTKVPQSWQYVYMEEE